MDSKDGEERTLSSIMMRIVALRVNMTKVRKVKLVPKRWIYLFENTVKQKQRDSSADSLPQTASTAGSKQGRGQESKTPSRSLRGVARTLLVDCFSRLISRELGKKWCSQVMLVS